MDVTVMLADGAEVIADLALLCDRVQVFGPVASTPTLGASWPASTTQR